MRAALGFLTIARLGDGPGPDRRAVAWFAPVGALVGLVVGLVWWGAEELWPPLLAATIAVAADAVLTGMLHLDGLADSADGLLPPLDRDRRLEVMDDPRAGVFAVVVVVLTLGVRVGALAALTPDPWLVAGLWAVSRAGMAVTLVRVPYARADGGLASVFRGAPLAPPLLGGVTGLVVVTLSQGWPVGPAVAAAAVLGMATVVGLARRHLGGFTGDVLGAAGIVGESVGLLVAAAQW